MLRFVDGFRDSNLAKKLVKHIKESAGKLEIKIVHVCGTHEDTITKYGIRSMLPPNVEVLMGPGCPVCTVSPNKIDHAITLAMKGIILTTFGDMIRVPSKRGSLSEAKARGGDIKIVYSINDAIKIAEKTNRDVVHFAVGFETTAPTTASELVADPPENFSIYSSHLLIPPAMFHLLKAGDTNVDGFINPGHVSAIIGEKGYKPIYDLYEVPQVIAGFEPLDILIAVDMVIRQINEGRGELENSYTRVVKPSGNPQALKLLDMVFKAMDAPWRGIGVIPDSGLALKEQYDDHNAQKLFELEEETDYTMPEGCRCGEILRALIYPWECPLFNNSCKPDSPVGPCMVSREGGCYIAAKYGREYK